MKKLLLTLFCLISLINIKAQTVITIGTGTTVNNTDESSPINIWYKSHHCRILYTAAELNAAGWTGASTITKLGFNIFSTTSEALPNFNISLKNTLADSLMPYNNGSFTNVYFNSSYLPTAGGFELFTLSTPFNWDGTSNLLVDICFDPVTNYSSTGQVYTYPYSSVGPLYKSTRDDVTPQCGVQTTQFNNPTYKPQLQLEMNPLAACSGSPIVNEAGTSDICSSITNFTLSLPNTNIAHGIQYQWQSSTDALNWTNYGTAQMNNHMYVVPSISNPTYFRCVATCTNGGFGSSSSNVLVHPTTAMNCHCKPYWSGFNIDCNSDKIVDFSLSNLINQPSTCFWPGYTDSTASINAQINLQQGIGYNLSLNTQVSGFNGDAIVGAWIDFDQSGSFEPSEYTSVGLGQSGNYQNSVNVPLNATLGTTRMRLMMDANNATTGTTLDPCFANPGNLGQILDYRVNIVPPPACSGTPNAGTAISTETIACANASFSLSLSGSDINSGLSYQWYSSPNGSVWNTLGSPSNSYDYTIASQTTALYYQCVVTCTNSSLSSTSTPISVSQKPIADCLCTPAFLECVNGDNFTTINFLSVNDNLACTAGENGYSDHTQTTTTSTVTAGQSFTIDMTYTGGSTGPAYISAWIDDNQNGFFEPIEQRTLAIEATTPTPLTGTISVPFYATGGLTRMRLKLETQWSYLVQDPCITNGYYGHAVDYYLQVIPAPACSGAPVAGNAVSSSSAVCLGNSYTLNLTGNEETNNLSFQWQSSNDGSVWTNLGSSQTHISYIIPSQSSTTHYRCIVSCLNSSLSSTSTPVIVNQNPLLACYCIPGPTDCISDNIVNVNFSGINNNSSCGANGFEDYTGTVASATVSAGQTYSLSATISSDINEYSSVWIDYNQNGVFDNSEHTDLGSTSPGNFTITGSVNIPPTAVPGLTRMRIRNFYNDVLEPSQACATPSGGFKMTSGIPSASGETEDYLITILPPDCSISNFPPSIGVTGSLDICPGGSTLLDVDPILPVATGITFQWKYFNGSVYVNLGSASTTSSYTAFPIANTSYFCEILCNGTPILNSDTVIVKVHNITITPTITNPVCFGMCNGSVVLNAFSAGSTVSYTWAPVGGNADIATNLCAGVYTINLENGAGCASTETIAITQPAALNATSSTTNVSCFGGSNGQAQVSVSGGSPTYFYNWNAGSTTAIATGLIPGTHTCTITDANGCTLMHPVTITEPTALNASISHTNVTCYGGNDGIATALATGGTAPYIYSWSPSGNTTQTATNLSAQQYTCMIADANNCLTSQFVTLTQATQILVGLGGNSNLCHNMTTTYSASITNAVGAVTYSWVSQPSGVTSSNTAFNYTATTVGTETIYVTVTDANGCSNTGPAFPINIAPSTNISGSVLTATTSAVVSGSVTLYKYEPFLTKFDSVDTKTIDAVGNYTFSNVDFGDYIVKAVPSSNTLQTTYSPNEISWQNANVLSHGCSITDIQNISVIPLEIVTPGTGILSGRVYAGSGYGNKINTFNGDPFKVMGVPIKGAIVKGGRNPGASTLRQTTTNDSGTYVLDNLPTCGPDTSYFVLVDIPGLDTNSTYHIVITDINNEFNHLDFIVDSVKVYPLSAVKVNEIDAKDFSLNVYPNPAQSQLNIDFNLKEEADVQIKLYDVIGKEMKSIINNNHFSSGNYSFRASIDDLASGIYFIKLNINQRAINIKIVKE